MKRLALCLIFLAVSAFPSIINAQDTQNPGAIRSLTFDDYGTNSSRYNACYPQVEYSGQFLANNPGLICVIDGHREPGEKKATSRLRAESARKFLTSHFGIEPERVIVRDRGIEKADRPLQMGAFDRDFNRRIVITFLKKLLASDPKEKHSPHYVFDYYGQRNSFQYDTCSQFLFMAGAELRQNPNLFCLLEGYRSDNEAGWVPQMRLKTAFSYLTGAMELPPANLVLRDGGKSDKSTFHPEKQKKCGFLAISVLEPVELQNWKSAVPFREDRHGTHSLTTVSTITLL